MYGTGIRIWVYCHKHIKSLVSDVDYSHANKISMMIVKKCVSVKSIGAGRESDL